MFRVMALYGGAAFAVLQAVDLLVPVLGLSDSVTQGVALFLLLGALAGMTVFLAGVWYLGWQSASMATPDAAAEALPSIAVLPFVNMSSDPEQEFFSDGISEELLNRLAKNPQLRVAARTSSFSFKDQNVEISEIAQRLKVAHILEGSVARPGPESLGRRIAPATPGTSSGRR